MGKRIISQRRGKGSPTYKSPSHRFKGSFCLPKQDKEVVVGKIKDIIHCPGHSSPVVKIDFENGRNGFLPAPLGIRVNDTVKVGSEDIENGNVVELGKIPEGTEVYNIEKMPGDGGKFVRSSGLSARVVSKFKNKVIVLLPSKKNKEFSPNCRAMIGVVAGGGRLEKPLMKAGKAYHKKRAKNKLYPRTSGISMNAVDHPYGTSRSSKKGRPTIARRNAPPGAKVGKIRARRTGRGKGKR